MSLVRRARRGPPRSKAQQFPNEYKAWQNAKQRAKDRELEFSTELESFDTFIAHVGKRPSPDHSLDRIDNNRGYVEGNIRWATKREQSNNRGNTVLLTYTGDQLPDYRRRTEPLTVWAEVLGTSASTLRRRRSDGWTDNEIIEGLRLKRRKRLSEMSTQELANFMPWPDDTAREDEARFVKEAEPGENRFEFERRVLIREWQRELIREGKAGKAIFIGYHDDEDKRMITEAGVEDRELWVRNKDTDIKVFRSVVKRQIELDEYVERNKRWERRWLEAWDKRQFGKRQAARSRDIHYRYTYNYDDE